MEEYLRYAFELLADGSDEAFGFILLAEAMKQAGEDGVRNAYELLRPLAVKFDDCLTVKYNLAAYSCRLGKLDEAREWLRKTFQEAEGTEFEGYYQRFAEDDTDLQPLWGEISKIGKSAVSGWLFKGRD